MGKEFFKKTTDLLQAKQKKKQWQKIVISLSLVVAMVTSGLLIHPAITMERKAICGQEEHTHSAECYEKKLICDKEEHTASEVEAAAAEGKTIEEHKHTDGCYKEELTCDKKEHKHSEDCYPKETEAKEETTKAASTEEAKATAADNTEAKTTEAPKAEETTEASNGEKKADEAKDETTEEKQEEKAEARTLTAKGDDYTVQVDCPAEAKIPEGAELKVREIVKENKADKEEYEAYYKKAQKALKEKEGKETDISSVRFFDITFMVDGKEIEPAAKVEVKITYYKKVEVSDKGEVKSVHFGDDKTEVLDVKTNEENGKMDEVTFDATSFSVYGVVETEQIQVPFTASDGRTYEVTINYNDDAGIPVGSTLEVSELVKGSQEYNEYVQKTADVINSNVDALNYVKLLDISIVKDGKKVQLDAPVNVQIRLLDTETVEENTQVVHFGEKETEVLGTKVKDDVVSFKTSGFSIYAITESTKRLVYEFYNGNTLLATEYIKSVDELYDPGLTAEYGQKFVGWGASIDSTTGKTIEELKKEVNEQLADSSIADLTTYKVYAVFTEAYYLRYMILDNDNNTIVWATDSVTKDASNKTLTVKGGPDLQEGQSFEGWIDDSTGTIYQAGEAITLDHNINLYIKLNGRYWLIFDSNEDVSDSESTYTPPQLIYGDDITTVKPDDPERKGYSFAGWNTKEDGTGDWWYKTGGTENRFGDTLSENVTLYAQWTPDETKYYVIYWQQKATDAVGLADEKKSYDYVSSVERTGKTGELVTLTTEDINKGGETTSTYGYYFTYNENNSDADGKKISAAGTTVLNVYYDRREITYQFEEEIYQEADYGVYGLVDGEYVQLYYKFGKRYYKVDENIKINDVYYITGESIFGNTYGKYSGDKRYSKVSSYLTFTGLYGSSFTEWPDPGKNYVWYEINNPRTKYPLPLTEFNPLSGGTSYNEKVKLTFSKTSYSTNYKLYIYVQPETETETGTINWDYSDKYLLAQANVGGGSWYPTETFTGFVVDSYQIGNTLNKNESSWNSITSTGTINYNNNLYLRYRRNTHSISFISEGVGADSRQEKVEKNIYYESSLNKYGLNDETNEWYYTPSNGKDGYEFVGWYLDEACTVEFDFENTKMPDHNITLYAKWEKTRIRVVLVPTPGNANDADVSFANNQELTFLLDYNEKVSGKNITGNAAQRTGYTLTGWYTSANYDASTLWNFDTQLNRNSQGVDMTYQSSEDWSKYGDNDGKHNNVKGILRLYAKWNLAIDENAVYIEYDVPDEYLSYNGDVLLTNIPVDTTAYVKQNDGSLQTVRIAQAPTNYNPNYTFKNWVLLDKDGKETTITQVPGETWNINESCIEERQITGTITNANGEEETVTRTMKVITFQGTFNLKEEKATTVIYDGNGGGVTQDGQTQIEKTLLINEGFTLLDKNNSFTRQGYTLVGWAFEANTDPALFNNAKGAVYNNNNHIGFALGTAVAADNGNIPLFNDSDNTLYAIWKAEPWTVTVKQIIQEENSTASIDYNFTSGIDDSNGFQLIGTTTPATEKKFEGIYAGTDISLPTPTDIGDYELVSITVNGDNYTEAGISEYKIDRDVVIVFTYKPKPRQEVVVQKLAGKGTNNYLNGAIFTLYKVGTTDTIITDSKVNASLGSNGQFTISNGEAGITLSLEYGNYKIKEITAPDGYIINSSDTYFTVDNDGVHMTTTDNNGTLEPITASSNGEVIEGKLVIYNEAGKELPHTGGFGTLPYTLGGLMLMSAAALMYGFIMRRRGRRLN